MSSFSFPIQQGSGLCSFLSVDLHKLIGDSDASIPIEIRLEPRLPGSAEYIQKAQLPF
jgi:hypothetical protein